MTDDAMSNEKVRVDSLANFLSGLGTEKDATTHARPTTDHRLTELECKVLWAYNDLARRIVDEVVEDAVRGGWTVHHAETGERLDDDILDIRDYVSEGGIRGRRDGTAFVWMVTGSGGQDTEFELRDNEDVVNLITLDRDEVTPREWNNDPRSPYYDEPETYWVTPHNNGAINTELQGITVHRSRLMRFDGNDLPDELDRYDEGYGDSVLNAVWTALRNFNQTEQAIANIVQRFETATISISGLADVLQTEEGQELIQKRMRLFQKSLSMLNAAIVDKDAGEDYTRKFATVNGLDTIWDRLAHSVSKAAKMPMTQLFGMSPSGLSSDDESGKANWRKQVASYQTDQFAENLRRFYEAMHSVPVEVRFLPLDETTASEESEIRERESKTLTAYIKSNVISPDQARRKLEDSGYIDAAERPEPEVDLDNIDAWRTDPYPTAESVPEHVPDDMASEWRKTFNEVFEDTGDEGRAYAVANDLLEPDG